MTSPTITNPISVQTDPNLFSSIVNNTQQGDGRYVYVGSGGKVDTENGFLHLFTTAKTNVSTLKALQKEITAKYGEDIGNAVSSQFEDFATGTKQLTVGDVRKAFKYADIIQINRSLRNVIREYGPDVGNILRSDLEKQLSSGKTLNNSSIHEMMTDRIGAKNSKNFELDDNASFGANLDKALSKAAGELGPKGTQIYSKTEQCMDKLGNRQSISVDEARKIIEDTFSADLLQKIRLSPLLKKESLTRAECRDLFQSAGKRDTTDTYDRILSKIENKAYTNIISDSLGLSERKVNFVPMTDSERMQFERKVESFNTLIAPYESLLNDLQQQHPNEKLFIESVRSDIFSYVKNETPLSDDIRMTLEMNAKLAHQDEVDLKDPAKGAATLARIDGLGQDDTKALIDSINAIQTNFPEDLSSMMEAGYNKNPGNGQLGFQLVNFETSIRNGIHCKDGVDGYYNLNTVQEKADFLTVLGMSNANMNGLIQQRLGLMREIQPNGPLTKDTIYVALTGRKDDLSTIQSVEKFRDLLDNSVRLQIAESYFEKVESANSPELTLLHEHYNELLKLYSGGAENPDPNMKVEDPDVSGFQRTLREVALIKMFSKTNSFADVGSLIMTGGLKPEIVMERRMQPGVLKKEDFEMPLSVIPGGISPDETPENSLKVWLNDFQRQNYQGGITTVTVRSPFGGDDVVCGNSTEGMTTNELNRFRSGEMMPQMQRVVDSMKALCTESSGKVNEKQLAVLILALTQVGPVGMMRNLSVLAGSNGGLTNEHSPCDYTINKNEDGSVLLSIRSTNSKGCRLESEYTIKTDGSSVCESMTLIPINDEEKVDA